MKEAKKYKLRATRKPKAHTLLSGVVHVCDQQGKRPAYFSFSEDFVDAVGKAMSSGLTASRPAYIKVLHIHGKGIWRIMAMYLNEVKGTVLWETDSQPEWTKPILKSISKNTDASTKS